MQIKSTHLRELPDVVPGRQHIGGVDQDREARFLADGEALFERHNHLLRGARVAEVIEHRCPVADGVEELLLTLDLDQLHAGSSSRNTK